MLRRCTDCPVGQATSRLVRVGHVCIHPTKDPGRSIDLKQLVDHLQLRGISLPTLIRFRDILQLGCRTSTRRFRRPSPSRVHSQIRLRISIKVNQQRQVVEEVLEFGRPFKFGLEAGSKPELIAVVALADNETPIICNGFKGRRVSRAGHDGP